MTMLTEEDLATAMHRATPTPPQAPDRADRARARARMIRRRRLATAGVAMAAVAAVVAAGVTVGTRNGNDPVPPGGGPVGSVGDLPVCPGTECDPAQIAATIQTPLDLPRMAADGSCPVSRRTTLPAGAGFSGPIKVTGSGALHLTHAWPGVPVRADDGEPGDGWMEQKVIWVFDKSYAGPLLLRGGRIDAPGQLKFLSYLDDADYTAGAGNGPRPGLLYVRGGLGAVASPDDPMTSAPSGIYVKGPGCYAIQVDGEGFTQHLVFRAVPDPS